jgi:hypothetical protein
MINPQNGNLLEMKKVLDHRNTKVRDSFLFSGYFICNRERQYRSGSGRKKVKE